MAASAVLNKLGAAHPLLLTLVSRFVLVACIPVLAVGLLLRLLVMPALALPLSLAFGMSGEMLQANVLESAMPTMITAGALAIAHNLALELAGKEPAEEATWNAVCLADFGDGGVAFVAQPQIPPRNLNWSSSGKWVHLAKVGFEKYFIRKLRKGTSEPFYESLALKVLGIDKLKETTKG